MASFRNRRGMGGRLCKPHWVLSCVCLLPSCMTCSLWSGGYLQIDLDRARTAQSIEAGAETIACADADGSTAESEVPIWAKVLFTPYALAIDAVSVPVLVVGTSIGFVVASVTAVGRAIDRY